MGFEEDILARTSAAIDQQNEQEDSERVARQTEARRNAERSADFRTAEDRAIELGTGAASLLLKMGVQSVPVWEDQRFGSPTISTGIHRSGATRIDRHYKTALDRTTEGWHVLTEFDHPEDIPSSYTNYGITSAVKLIKFKPTLIPEYKDPRTHQTSRISGIIRPEPYTYPGLALRVLESDTFKNALAFVVATKRVYISRL